MTEPNNGADFGRLIVQGADRPGIVARVSTVLSENGANIVSLAQSSSDPSGGRFFQRTVFHLPDLAVKLEALREVLDLRLRAELDLDFRLVEAKRRKRVAIFVSRADHCLLDLLWRQRRGELDMTVPMVVSNHPDLRDDVRQFGIPFVHVPVAAGAPLGGALSCAVSVTCCPTVAVSGLPEIVTLAASGFTVWLKTALAAK